MVNTKNQNSIIYFYLFDTTSHDIFVSGSGFIYFTKYICTTHVLVFIVKFIFIPLRYGNTAIFLVLLCCTLVVFRFYGKPRKAIKFFDKISSVIFLLASLAPGDFSFFFRCRT